MFLTPSFTNKLKLYLKKKSGSVCLCVYILAKGGGGVGKTYYVI